MSLASATIFHLSYCHPPNFLLRKTPRNLQVSSRTTRQRRSSYRFSSLPLVSRNHLSSDFFNGTCSNSFPVFGPGHISVSGDFLDRVLFGPDDNSFRWNFASGRYAGNQRNGIAVLDESPEVTVVILGWLGAKPKHLRWYVELYNVRGIHAAMFVVSVMDVLSYDLAKKTEERIEKLANELASWLSNEGVRDRFLIFHTFSNTGWLAYGAILGHLKEREYLLVKIKGCIVDSGGAPDIDPKVWAAGFTAALLKKSSSATYPSPETGGGTGLGIGENGSKIEGKNQILIEAWLLFAFEKLFSCVLNLPDINRRLAKVVSILSKNQPPCPQLYLYSTGDKVIPFQRVESFIEDQRRAGKQVFSFNFGSSPHVDHYRTFHDLYVSQLDKFLNECLIMVEKL